MKHSKLTAPKASSLASRKGGNGGYSQKSTRKCEPMVKRKFNLRDYHGNKIKR